jgi:hypothetical protein
MFSGYGQERDASLLYQALMKKAGLCFQVQELDSGGLDQSYLVR